MFYHRYWYFNAERGLKARERRHWRKTSNESACGDLSYYIPPNSSSKAIYGCQIKFLTTVACFWCIPCLAVATLHQGRLTSGSCKKRLIQSYKNIYLTGFNQCTIAQIRIKLTAEVDIESVAQNDYVSNKERDRQAACRF